MAVPLKRRLPSVAGLLRFGNSTQKNAQRFTQQTGCLATPDATELGGSLRVRTLQPERVQDTPESGPSQAAFDPESPTESEFHPVYSGSTATPPVDGYPEPLADLDESLQQSIRAHQNRPVIDVAAAQDASLPSPRLSPTLAVTQVHNGEENGDSDDGFGGMVRTPRSSSSALSDPRNIVERFDQMTDKMQTVLMYNLLRRCTRSTLRVVADAVNPALKCDFMLQLPLELSYYVLSYLDCVDLCRAAQVSKHWRTTIDCNETGWKNLFDRDGYKLARGELDRAVAEGWGWQDPSGPHGAEIDLAALGGLSLKETGPARLAQLKKRTSTKRKRPVTSGNADRAKRRAASSESSKVVTKAPRPEGPVSASIAAITALPDPGRVVGKENFASLNRMHLFKSIYRRHKLIKDSWTSGEVKPSHIAFASHPRHVITCLQFDDDKIITGSDDMLIHIYETKTGKLYKRLEGHDGGVWALQYDGNTLVSGSTDRTVRVWDMKEGICTQIFYGHTSTVRCLQILRPVEVGRDSCGQAVMMPAEPIIITGSRDNSLRVWKLPGPGAKRSAQGGPPSNVGACPYFCRVLEGHTNSVRAISAHGDTLVSGSYDGTVRVWQISTGKSLQVLAGHAQKVYSVILDHERNHCISGSMDSLVKIWDLATGSCLHTLEGHSLLVGLLDLRDQRLVSAAADSTLRIWDPQTGKCRHVLEAHTGAITCFQHDGRKVVSGSEKTVKMWDIRTGDFIHDLLTDLSGVWQVKFDQRRCVAAVQRDGITFIEVCFFLTFFGGGWRSDGEAGSGLWRVT